MAQPNPQPVAKTGSFVWNTNTVWIYLSYVFLWIHGLIGLSVVKDVNRVRFHCAQAIALSAALTLVFIVLGIISAICAASLALGAVFAIMTIDWIVGLAYYVFVIFIMIQAAQGKDFRVPFFADFAEKNLMKLFK